MIDAPAFVPLLRYRSKKFRFAPQPVSAPSSRAGKEGTSFYVRHWPLSEALLNRETPWERRVTRGVHNDFVSRPFLISLIGTVYRGDRVHSGSLAFQSVYLCRSIFVADLSRRLPVHNTRHSLQGDTRYTELGKTFLAVCSCYSHFLIRRCFALHRIRIVYLSVSFIILEITAYCFFLPSNDVLKIWPIRKKAYVHICMWMRTCDFN